MTGPLYVKMPKELNHPLFFCDGEIHLDPLEYQMWKNEFPIVLFPYECLAYHGIEAYRPWYDHSHIPELFRKWEGLKEKCSLCFKARKSKEAIEPMKQGIGLFLMALFYMNQSPVHLQDWGMKTESFSYKPLNVRERLSFVMDRPAFFASFEQLKELYRELEKRYAKFTVMK